MIILSAVLLVLLVGAALVVGGVGRLLGRPIPTLCLAAFGLLSVLPFPRAYFSDATILPLDHAAYIRPWYEYGNPPPFNPYLSDLATQILPWAKATRLAWKEGEAPFRNRWNGSGLPLAANGVSAALSPFTFLALFLPLARSYTLVASLKLLLAAAGMWLWARELKATSQSASFAAVAYALSLSFAPPFLVFPQSSVLCLWPWTLWLVERLRDPRGRNRTTAALTLVFVFLVLAGHPETAALGVLFTALWILGRWLARDFRPLWPTFRLVCVAGLLALCLTAFLVFPTYIAIRSSGRIAAMAEPYWASLLSLAPHGPWWREVPTSFFPHTLGDGVNSPLLPISGPAFAERSLGYFGIVGWALVLLILRPGSPRTRAEWALLGLLIVGFGISTALWPFAEIAAAVPMIRYVLPHRFHSWEALAGPVIVALELDRLVRDSKPYARRTAVYALLVPVVIGIAAVLVYVHFYAQHAAVQGNPFQKTQLIMVLATLGLTVLLAAVLRRRPRWYIYSLTFLCACELLSQWRATFRLSSPSLLFPQRPSIAYLRAQPAPFRVLGARSVLFPSTNVFAEVEEIRTHDALERLDYVRLLNAAAGYPPDDYFKAIGDLNAPVLDFLNVRYLMAEPGSAVPGGKWKIVYSGPDATIYENTRVLTRAFAPRRIQLVVADGDQEGIPSDLSASLGSAFDELVSLRDWQDTAYVLADHGETVVNGPTEVRSYSESTNSAEMQVTIGPTGRDGFVVLSLVQDGGWSARNADGTPVPIHYANGPFMALRLPPGEHRVRLTYVPPGLKAGLAGGVGTFSALLAAFFWTRHRSRKRAVITLLPDRPNP